MATPMNRKCLSGLRRQRIAAGLMTVWALSTLAAPSGELHAATTVSVLNCDNSGTNSLRAAVTAATDGTVIDMTGLACSTISLTTGAIIIDHSVSNLTLDGPTNHTLTVTGNDLGRVLVHNGEGTLTLDHMTITHGSYLSGYYGGGCLYALGSVSLQDSTVSNCRVQLSLASSSAKGGGIYANGNLTLTRSVLSGNQAINSSGSAGAGGAFVRHNVTANFSSIRNNFALAPAVKTSLGGGIFTYGTTQVYATTFSGNQAAHGGAIATVGSATFGNSTISGNQASKEGGGIYAIGSLTLNNTTVAFNTQSTNSFGAGVLTYGALMVTSSSIIANNTSIQNGNDYSLRTATGYTTVGGSNNLITASLNGVPGDTITQDPKLAPLANNGGPTLTHALKLGSPAIDVGLDHGFSFDQRQSGHPRILGGAADIGAFELDTDLIFSNGFD